MSRGATTTGLTRDQLRAGRLIRQAREANDLTRAQANTLTEQVLGGNLTTEGVAQTLGITLTPVNPTRRTRRGRAGGRG